MRKTIIITSIALVAMANFSFANKVQQTIISKEIVVNYSNTPLCNAILKGDLQTVKKFIEYGTDVNEESNGMTPLMFAARYNKVDIVKLLLEKGADKKAKDERGFTALKFAELSNSLEVIAILKQV